MPSVLAAALLFVRAASGGVVINEVMYHPPDDRDDLQWVELFQNGSEAVDLAGWSFKKGIQFVFPEGAVLPPGGFAVVARDTNAFRARYRPGSRLLLFGNFQQKLSHSGETIALANRAGKSVDSVHYSDTAPWPSGADGCSASLERICPGASGRDPYNWAASELPPLTAAAGTPGATNQNYCATLPPAITNVTFATIASPGEPVAVTAAIGATRPLTDVLLRWVAFSNGVVVTRGRAPMRLRPGSVSTYDMSLPAEGSGVLTRFWVHASDGTATRVAPSPNEPRSSFSVVHLANTNTATVPFAYMLTTGPVGPPVNHFATPPPAEPTRGNAAWIIADTNHSVQLFDHVRLQRRAGGWKVHFQHDRTYRGMTTLNMIYEQPRYALAEALGDEVFRRADVPAPETGYMRLWLDGQPLGFHLTIEQVNKSFLAHRGRDTRGDLFKLLWYPRNIVAQHEKKTNPLTGHTNLLALLHKLQTSNADKRFDIIQSNFNAGEVASYFAVCQLIGNWDGYHNNQFIYHDRHATGRWEIYPWDLDKTFGDFDGAPSDYAWYDMPLTYGMEGDRSPGVSASNATRIQGEFGGVSWWRPGGPFSRPLLANPAFQALVRARIRDLLEREYTEDKLFPWLTNLERQLEPEIRARARAQHDNEFFAVRTFHSNVDSLRHFITGRRKFLLAATKDSSGR